MGYNIFVQSADRTDDGFKSLKDRADSVTELKAASKAKDEDEYAKIACEKWIDVRGFGQVFAFKGDKLSVGVRGPVSIRIARSINPIVINEMQITKSVNSVSTGKGKSSDTMGMKYNIGYALYEFSGSINVQLAEKNRL
ncbi:Cas7 group CRISPR-associated protein Csh2 [Lactobacillus colini]|uniref:Cas7 group CRISPR-associated protein Csh2 n=1 Tax=Lactobacillus colini TaxID=1819254 RepID=A0ABS4MI07_9LACO|nr:Cas7 group CRISPR-associated protein Csh2 [Lactobacillus colini]